MRIDRLRLPQFRNLQNFEVDFDQGRPRQVIVGRNGVGKSNLLEAIARIFRDLDLEVPSRFPFEIDFLCKGKRIKIRCMESEDSNNSVFTTYRRSYFIADEETPDLFGKPSFREITEPEFFRLNRSSTDHANPNRVLPNYVFGYYSGTSSRFEAIFAEHEERYYEAQITGEEAPLRSLFLAKPHHSQFAFMSFFAVEDPGAEDFLRREMRIRSFDSALFVLRQPYWAKGKRRSDEKGGDRRFWGAAGKVAPFLSKLFEHSLAPMSFSQKLPLSIGQTTERERRFCFVPSLKALRSLANGLTNKEFFARLEGLVFSDLVNADGSDVRTWLRLEGKDGLATFNELAEGERQLLTVLGLLRFTAEEEALFILDEPDTYLNPAWCLDYLEHLRRYGADLSKSQVLVTTHSPLTFAGLEKDEVVIMERGEDGRIYAEHPLSSPKGMGFQAILTSDFFKLNTTLDRGTLHMLDEKRELALKDEKTDHDRKRLAELDQQLGRLDFSKAARDPLYLEFIRAMKEAESENPEIATPVPLEESWRLRKKIAGNIAKRLARRGSDV
jgi:predicted ATPase